MSLLGCAFLTDRPAIVRENVSIAQLTTIGIGGAARYFAKTALLEELKELLAWAGRAGLPVFVLGGGSNVLFSDAGFPGLVIQPAFMGICVEESQDFATARVAAGENWDSFVANAVASGWNGIECLSGIPGFVGAAPIQNIGAYGQEVGQTILQVEAWDRRASALEVFSNEECEFAYRASRFKGRQKNEFIITAVSFRLSKVSQSVLRYAELSCHFDELGVAHPTLQQVREAVLEIRRSKAMVVDPVEPNSKSCGSFFMNPIISRTEFEQMLARNRAGGLLKQGESMPSYDAGEGRIKLSAAWLMERAGLRRGERHGNVGLSEKHVLAIVNRGAGTAAEVLQFVGVIQNKVHKTFGITLEPEPVLLQD